MTATNPLRDAPPHLTVVIAIVRGGHVLRRFLEAIGKQAGAPSMEVLLPFDESVSYVGMWQPEYPDVRFIAMGPKGTVRSITSAAGQHELIDERRTAGLLHARGDLVAILEDRSAPRPDWAATMTRLHKTLPHGAIGGAIECASDDLLNWAFWACDFSRYALPFTSGPRTWLSDANVCYKRRCVEMTREVWEKRFNEATLHWTLMEQGETLYLSNEAVVENRTDYRSLFGVLPERFHWGRLFGSARAEHVSPLRRLAYVLAGPAIPFVLFARHWRVQNSLGNGARFVAAARYMMPLLIAWTTGEVWGYVTRRW